MTIKVLFDDAFFSLANSGIASYWRNILKYCEEEDLFRKSQIDFAIVNRSDAFINTSFELIDFPKLDINRLSTDVEILSKLSEYRKPDLFISTYYTYVPGLKSLGVIYDLIPEILDFGLTEDIWQHRFNYFYQVTSNMVISDATLRDLLTLYPFKSNQPSWVIRPGIDLNHFKRASESEIARFRSDYNLGNESFIIFLGARHQKDGYKNSQIFFESLSRLKSFPYNVVCVGGEDLTEAEINSCESAKIKLFRLEFNLEELPTCLSAGVCLVYPSLYEGFGMPVLEALAVGTPVVTSSGGGLMESGGSLATRVDVVRGDKILEGIEDACHQDWAVYIQKYGPAWARGFSWGEAGKIFINAILETHDTTPSIRVQQGNVILRQYHNKMKYLE